jgi:hypothetical protein
MGQIHIRFLYISYLELISELGWSTQFREIPEHLREISTRFCVATQEL